MGKRNGIRIRLTKAQQHRLQPLANTLVEHFGSHGQPGAAFGQAREENGQMVCADFVFLTLEQAAHIQAALDPSTECDVDLIRLATARALATYWEDQWRDLHGHIPWGALATLLDENAPDAARRSALRTVRKFTEQNAPVGEEVYRG